MNTFPWTRTLWRPNDGRVLMERITRLTPASRAAWGRMSAPQMVAHLQDATRMVLGDVPVRRANGWAVALLRHFPLKQLFIYCLPFPRNAPTASVLLRSVPGSWSDDLNELDRLLERVTAQAARRDARWPEHPFFGRLSTRAWGVLGYRHMDHHLRQFGV